MKACCHAFLSSQDCSTYSRRAVTYKKCINGFSGWWKPGRVHMQPQDRIIHRFVARRKKDHTQTQREEVGLYTGCSKRQSPKTRPYCLSQPHNDVRTQGCFGSSCSSSPAGLHLALGKELILARPRWSFPPNRLNLSLLWTQQHAQYTMLHVNTHTHIYN